MSEGRTLIGDSPTGSHPRTVAIIQARMGSMRFPKKVMRPICGSPLIGLLLRRLSKARRVDLIVLATSEDPRNDGLAEYVDALGFAVFRGSENDVLDRYYRAAKKYSADVVVRVTGDCPLIDPVVVDEVIAAFLSSDVDYASNVAPPTYPNGLDTEVFSFQALKAAWNQAKAPREREHVTPYIREQSQFSQHNVAIETDESNERWTVDEPADFEVVQKVFEHFHPRVDFDWREILALRLAHPEWFEANRHLRRNEGALLGSGQKLRKRAMRLIPTGSMGPLKLAETELPDQWPSYFSKAKGCHVWDLDGREFVDMWLMGNGTSTLGYGHPEVDAAVAGAIVAGNISTLNFPEEIYLAERLVELHPWAEMVQLTRSEGEAGAMAVRIGCAASGRNNIADCGSATRHGRGLGVSMAGSQSPAAQRADNSNSNGTRESSGSCVFPVRTNDFSHLQAIVTEHDVGVIKIDLAAEEGVSQEFLQGARKLANTRGSVLIFDESMSGFRETFGGLHMLFRVDPDMAIFGTALGNGYAINSVVGRRAVMQAMPSTVTGDSTSMGRIGPTAALKTLEVMEREKSWERISERGRAIGKRWQDLAKRYDLPLRLGGLPALISFNLSLNNMPKYREFIAREMAKANFLAGTSVYVCTAHTEQIVDQYFDALAPVFALIQECESGRSIDELLIGPAVNS